MSLRWKLVLAIGVPVVIVSGAIMLVQFRTLHASAVAEARHEVSVTSAATAASLEGALRGVAWTVISVASELADPLDEDVMRQAGVELLSRNELMSSTFVSRLNGQPHQHRVDRSPVAPRAASPDVGTLASQLESPPRGVVFWTGPTTTGAAVMICTAPVLRQGGLVGAVTAHVPLELLMQLVVDDPDDEQTPLVMTSTGRFLLQPEPDGVHLDPAQRQHDLWQSDAINGLGAIRAFDGFPNGRDHLVGYNPVSGVDWSVATAIAQEDILAPVRQQILTNLLLMSAGVILLLGVVFYVGFRIVHPLRQLARAVDRLGHGDLDVQVDLPKGHDELAALACGFNDMTTRLRDNIKKLAEETAARERIEGEVRLARRIQEMLLPKAQPACEGRTDVEVWALNEPARVLAGDFFDIMDHGDHLTIVMADVSGKGPGAAMFMAMAHTLIRILDDQDRPLSDLVSQLNARLYSDSHGVMFVTLIVLRYHPASGVVELVNGGHPPPIRLDASGGVELIGASTGPLVGGIDSGEWGVIQITLEPADRLVLFTDGVTEAVGAGGAQLGSQGLIHILRDPALQARPASEFCQGLIDAVKRHNQVDDDLTVLVLGRPA